MCTLVQANGEFGVDLLKILLENSPNRNVFLSPLTISAALGMVSLGACGETAKQMERALHFDGITGSNLQKPKDMPVTGACCDRPGGPHEQFKVLLSAINQHTRNYALSIANRLYGSNTYRFHQHYLNCTKELYHAELETVDFMHANEEAKRKINSWVESQTNGKIKNLFEDIDPEAALILVNGIYFKGNWKLQFDPKQTREAPFWTSKNQSKQVPMMFLEGEFNLAKIKNPAMEVLQLPYDHDDLSMFILLPDNREYPDELGRGLTWAKLQEWTSSANMKQEKVDVFIPKFKLEEKYSLKPVLQAMGMTDVFTQGKADLSGMSEGHAQNLILSRVIHESYVEVNEEGSEAAGATGVEVIPVKMNPIFRADRGFLFLIKHEKTQSILFLGRFFSP